MKPGTTCCILLVALVSLPMPLMAQPDSVSFRFVAHVGQVWDPSGYLGGAISVNDQVAGCFRYDLNAEDTIPEEGHGLYSYDSVPNRIDVTINGLVFKTDPDDTDVLIEILDAPVYPHNADLFLLNSYGSLLAENPTQEWADVICLEFSDHTMTTLSSDALPTSFSMNHWDYRILYIISSEIGVMSYIVDADVDSISVCPSNESGLCSNGIDDDCDGLIDVADPDCTSTCAGTTGASTLGKNPVHGASDLGKHLVYLLVPVGVIIGMSIWRRRK